MLQDPPFVFKTRKLPKREDVQFEHYYDEDGEWYYYGFCIDLIFKINQTMNFDLTISESSDGAYGTMQDNGSWSGLVSDLMEDVSVCFVRAPPPLANDPLPTFRKFR